MLYYCSSYWKKTEAIFPRDPLQGPARAGGKGKKKNKKMHSAQAEIASTSGQLATQLRGKKKSGRKFGNQTPKPNSLLVFHFKYFFFHIINNQIDIKLCYNYCKQMIYSIFWMTSNLCHILVVLVLFKLPLLKWLWKIQCRRIEFKTGGGCQLSLQWHCLFKAIILIFEIFDLCNW